MRRSRSLRLLVYVVCPAIALAWWRFEAFRTPENVHVSTARVTSGPIVRRIVVTGTLEPMTTVDVGTEVSGTVQDVSVDYNAAVHAGDVLLRLDPASFEAALDESRGVLAQADADLTNAKEAAAGASAALTRDEALAMRRLVPQVELDEARTALAEADAEVTAQESQEQAARAGVQQALVRLRQTVIRSPVDGIVLARNAEAGVTVAAESATPTLFRIATDFQNMQVLADVDESDLAGLHAGETATFTVGAYPGRMFEGEVADVRLDARREQPGADTTTARGTVDVVSGPAVVSYPVVVVVTNSDGSLRPGMTATVTLDVAHRDVATRIPNTALSFVPTAQVLKAAGQKPVAPEPPPVADPAGAARVWAYDGVEFTPIPVRTGVSDDEWTELASGPLSPGEELVTGADLEE